MDKIEKLLNKNGLVWETYLFGEISNERYVESEITYMIETEQIKNENYKKQAKKIMMSLFGNYGNGRHIKCIGERIYSRKETTEEHTTYFVTLLENFIEINVGYTGGEFNWVVSSNSFDLKELEVDKRKRFIQLLNKKDFDYTQEEKMQMLFKPEKRKEIKKKKVDQEIEKIEARAKEKMEHKKGLLEQIMEVIENKIKVEVMAREITNNL